MFRVGGHMPKRKTIVIPEGAHPITAWRLTKDFMQGELSTLLKFDRKILEAIECGIQEPTEQQKYRIRLITGIKI